MTALTAEDTPSNTAVAVICAMPTLFAVTRPVAGSTVATAVLFDVHWIVRPGTTVLHAVGPLHVAVSCTLGLSDTLRLFTAGVIATDVTAVTTFSVAVSAFVSAVAMICTWPLVFPDAVTVGPDFGETSAPEPGVATHVMVRSVTTVPFTSLTVAVN